MSTPEYRRIIAVDFDGTLAVTKFPEIIKPIKETIQYCKRQQAKGAILILWTCRRGDDLKAAVEWCRAQGIEFDHINENTPENIAKYGGDDTRKFFAHEYIDDKAINPVRERAWKRRLRRTLAGQGISACLATLSGMAAGIVAIAAIMCWLVRIY